MQLISDEILIDSGQINPTHDAAYPMLKGFEFANPNSWTSGHPFEMYRKMREQAPVHWSPGDKRFSGFWSVTRYEDIKAVELAPTVFSSERGSINIGVGPREQWKPKKLIPAAMNSLINLDAPRHMEMRIQQKDFFIPAYVVELREKVAAKIDSLLDDMERAGPELDFVKMFSEQVPLYTLCEMLGVDEEDRPKIVHWMHYLELAAQYSANKLQVILGKLGGDELQQEYLDGSWLLIIFAGNDTSRNSLSGTIRLMTEFKDQRQMILDEPSLIPAMSQEALRMVSPVQHMRRTAIEDTELNGQKIAKDEKVANSASPPTPSSTLFLA